MSDTVRCEENLVITLLFAQSGKNMAVKDVRASHENQFSDKQKRLTESKNWRTMEILREE